MLILTAKDIKYCQPDDRSYSERENHPSIYYRGFVFVRIASFTYNQFQTAIKISRQFLDQNEPVTALIVKDIDRITLWAEAGRLNSRILE